MLSAVREAPSRSVNARVLQYKQHASSLCHLCGCSSYWIEHGSLEKGLLEPGQKVYDVYEARGGGSSSILSDVHRGVC